jgi:hypothetical protein
VEEDLAKAGMERSEMVGLRSIYLWIGITLFTSLLALTISCAVDIYALNAHAFWTIWGFCFGLAIQMIILSFFYYAMQISRDHECFAKYPPRLPNLLSILTGEEKAPREVGNKINIWGDLTGIGLGWSAPVMLFGIYFAMSAGLEYVLFGVSFSTLYISALLFSLLLLAYFVFAIFFAGIPRRRYWGMIFLGVNVLLIDTGVLLIHLMLSQEDAGIIWFAYVFSAWYLLCFTLLGAAGLWVFRKR